MTRSVSQGVQVLLAPPLYLLAEGAGRPVQD